MAREHGVSASVPIGAAEAEQVARVMSALATASRVRILAHLRQGPTSVGDLTEQVDMAQPAVSHQLRVLRDLGLVVGTRDGRHTVYELYDTHVHRLLDEALRHVDHTQDHTRDEREPEMTQHEHEHSHDGVAHTHPHTDHQHDHVAHEHAHTHGAETHAHEHLHDATDESVHEHSH